MKQTYLFYSDSCYTNYRKEGISMKKTKRIFAIIGIILLTLLYLSTLVFALLGKDFMNWLMASLVSTIMIPVFIWALGFVYKLVHGKKDNE